MTATKRTQAQPHGPQPDRTDIANAYHVLTCPDSFLAAMPTPAVVAAITEDVLRRLADIHRSCKLDGCTRCGLLRHGLAYVYALEILAES